MIKEALLIGVIIVAGTIILAFIGAGITSYVRFMGG